MSATGHALLSPSASHRWIHCTPSARLEENTPDLGSSYAYEGTIAHALCESKILALMGEDNAKALAEVEEGRDLVDTEMENCAEEYASLVWNKYQEALKSTSDARLFIERQLDFSAFVPDSFGTADAIIIADGRMEVIDFKYGKGVEVYALENPQMMIYALGAIQEFEIEYNISSVRMTIVQPRKQNISEWEISCDLLLLWMENILIPAARKAYKGEGEQEPGEWCRFCKVKATCSKLANQAIAVYTKHEDKATISVKEMADILKLIPSIKTWCTAVEDYATAQAIGGTKFDGWKLVEGRSLRRITDERTLGNRMAQQGYVGMYREPSLKPIGDLEKMCGKKKFAELAEGLIEKPQGKPTLVPVSDKREPIRVSSAINDFKDLNLD